ncbi:RagB/SusD family nutrient uptake outer membrane protein [Mangrovibacterium sp.]|uniref:RagB/SusD family nutrient uptake outer membrane protein n=1 Tax=Mangrovibacterium sp. TaxID=1961364 RepID=UPI0035698E22
MKNIKKILFVLLVLFFAGCQDDFIDLDPLDSYTEEIYYKTPEQFSFAANELYTNLVGWQAVRGSGLGTSYNTGYGDWMNFGTDLTALAQDYGRGTNTVSNVDVYWTNHYYFLLDANTLIEKALEYEGNATDIESYVATAHWFRAYHYYELLTRFGGVPIVTSRLDVTDELLIGSKRNSRYEVVSQILSDLDVAIAGCPQESAIASSDKGKISKEGAQAMKARVLLLAATWDTYVGTTTDGDGVTVGAGSNKPADYPSTDAMLTEAISLCNAVMTSGTFELWNYNDVLNNMTSFHLFNIDGSGSNPAGLDKSSNHEFIVQGIYDFIERQSSTNISHTVRGRLDPSRKFLDLFLCTDGLPIDKSPLFKGYSTLWDETRNRDYRMWAYYHEMIEENSSPVLTGETDINSGVGLRNSKHKAYLYEETDYRVQGQESQNFPYLRLAEVYLNYAEALYERDGAISDADLNKSLNLVRARAGIAPLTNSFATTNGLDIREEIRRERAIELFGENSRFIDLKRWGIAEEALGATIHGPVIEGTVYETNSTLYDPALFPDGEESIVVGDGTTKRTVIIDPSNERPFARQHYLYSIPVDEIIIAPELLQNPGW